MPFSAASGGVREATEGDGAWRALAAAIGAGRTIAALQREGASGAPDAALVCRASAGLAELWDAGASGALAAADERALGRDQSNTSVVLGERLLLKAYRRVSSRG